MKRNKYNKILCCTNISPFFHLKNVFCDDEHNDKKKFSFNIKTLDNLMGDNEIYVILNKNIQTIMLSVCLRKHSNQVNVYVCRKLNV